MPVVGSWDGKWTGADDYHAIVRYVRDEKGRKVLSNTLYDYDFGDGWVARIAVRPVAAYEMNTIREKSAGFCGYEWMIDAIIYEGEIFAPSGPKEGG